MRRVLCLASPRLPLGRCATTARLQYQLQLQQQQQQRCSSSFSERTLKYAVLIDADCCEHTKIQLILDEIIAMGGEPSVRRAYGDFALASNHPWKVVCQTHSILPIQAFVSATSRKTSTDSAVTIDAMDLLHTNTTLDGFVLITGDSDFGRLAQRLREAGKHVVGVGQETASPSFVKSCDHFIHADELEFPKIVEEIVEEPDEELVEEEIQSEKSEEQTETESIAVLEEPENHKPKWFQSVRDLWIKLPLISGLPSTVPDGGNANGPPANNDGRGIAVNAESTAAALTQTLSPDELSFFHDELNALADDEDDDDDDELRWVSLTRVDQRVAYALPDFNLRERGYERYSDMFRNYPDEFEVMQVNNSDQYVRSRRFLMDDESDDSEELSLRQEIEYFHELLNSAADRDREDGWVFVSFLGDHMSANRPDFSPRKLGFKGILHMLQQFPDQFEFFKIKDTWRVRSRKRE